MTTHRDEAQRDFGHLDAASEAIVHALLHLADTFAAVLTQPEARTIDMTAPTAPREDLTR